VQGHFQGLVEIVVGIDDMGLVELLGLERGEQGIVSVGDDRLPGRNLVADGVFIVFLAVLLVELLTALVLLFVLLNEGILHGGIVAGGLLEQGISAGSERQRAEEEHDDNDNTRERYFLGRFGNHIAILAFTRDGEVIGFIAQKQRQVEGSSTNRMRAANPACGKRRLARHGGYKGPADPERQS
jgi:hypothetical protein